MSQPKAKAAGTSGDPPVSPGSGKKRIVLAAVALLLIVAAGGGGFFVAKKASNKEKPSAGDETVSALAADVEHGGAGQESEESGKAHGAEKKGHGSEKKGHGAKAGAEDKDPLSFSLQAISTNLNEESVRRGIQVAFVLKARDEQALRELKENETRIMSDIIILLGSKTQAELRMRDGKELLLEEVKTRANRIVGEGKVKDAWFSAFVLIQ